jgi:hypothetical protein
MRDIVRANLRNAVENGYYCDLDELSADEIVVELLAFAADCEDATEAELLPHVAEWVTERRQTLEAAE